MTISFPRISITVDDDRGMGTQGELSGLSLGFGIHQAWIYASMFGSSMIFQAPLAAVSDHPDASISTVFLISIFTFAVSMLFAAITDQKMLRWYTAKRVLAGAAIVSTISTFMMFAVSLPGSAGLLATVFAGIATGVGSAVLTLFWGVAYSRDSAASIVMNAAVSIVIAVAIYSALLHIVPDPFSGILTACLPLLELPLLWKLTPVSYAVRHAVPIFNPLPIRKSSFILRLALPMVMFGFALGALRSLATQVILPSADVTTQLIALFAGGAATILLMVTVFSIDKRSHWDVLFRPLIPFVAATLFFLPALTNDNSMIAQLVLLTGYMCFEALLWVFFGEMAQEFRLSPIFVFGVGRGCLGLGSIVGAIAMADPDHLGSLLSFGDAGPIVFIMFALVVAYALLPRVRDIKRITAKGPLHQVESIAAFNRRAEQITWSTRRDDAAGSMPEAVHPLGALDMLTTAEEVPAAPLPQPVATGWRTGTIGLAAAAAAAEAAAAQASAMGEVAPQQTKAAEATTSAQDGSARNAMNGTTNSEPLSEGERSRKSGRFRMQCETIANRYLLSRRETEVMFLLAKGHNAARIQDKLCISRSTAKTHISHIYRKLDIHNQQELLAMVEDVYDEQQQY